METDADFVVLEDMLKVIHSGSELALAKLAQVMEDLRRKKEAEETSHRT